uniref:BRCT domain-containing protein n=1 Tax=Pelodiscus sinensis TaxID=13735 RepID=K7FP83_PELSI
QVLLVTSSFMSPSESKAGTNLNRVRMFGPDKLVKAAAEKKWDRVKIVCTQPYTKTLAYGLSFVKFHSPPENNETPSKSASPKVTKLGQFKVKDEDGSSASLRPGALFFSRASKPLLTPPKGTGNFCLVAVTSLLCSHAASPTEDPSPSPAAVGASASPTEDPSPSPAVATLQASTPHAASPSPPAVGKPTARTSPSCAAASPKCWQVAACRGRAGEPCRRPRAPSQRWLHVGAGEGSPVDGPVPRPRGGCTSGPGRGALSTAPCPVPEVAARRGRGGEPCRRPRAPSQRWLHVGAGEGSPVDGPVPRPRGGCTSGPDPAPTKRKFEFSKENAAPARKPDPKASHPAQPTPKKPKGESSGRGWDAGVGGEDPQLTHAPCCRVEEEHRKKQQAGREVASDPDDDPYGGSTDENTDVEVEPDLPIPELPDFFVGKRFFLYGEFPAAERRLLHRYITAFNGEVEGYMNERVNYVVTAQEWDDAFEEAQPANANLSFVRPRWIHACSERQRLAPPQPYVVVPRA